MLRSLLFCTMILGLAPQPGAGDTPLLRLDTGDQGRGWEAVGRLEIDGHGFCTGAMIADDLVVTAAHCLYDKANGERVDPAGIEFRAGWRNGRAEAYRTIKRAVVHPDYDYDGEVATDRVRNDLALLLLGRPIRTTAVTPFATVAGRGAGQAVGIVSYAHDRADAPSLQEMCHVIGHEGGVLVTSCDVDFGSSGSPIFSFEGGTARIVSVVSAKALMNDRPVALGTELSRPLADLQKALENDAGHFLRARPGALNGPRKTQPGGAKFVRP
ncbi:trypsin-like serine protease [Lutimaribacter sp. EGI FJ00015]|uniref:Trypsin-like serine protease n=1 Tax=Lutimaribacter degradans TaxID=2945989 RepID=A0ACC5ZXH6_9RHOB|nr:trypsin-like serine protease [Lutimaribacter sp. EGI FJ00013]MCM2563063.1 trypsin-like serine protease [Lutimaribacter sp. EGI FJ00013]MCO0614242.1 trypsin-like serine protease [Lutimaribacter sp. EGI FJ00015]MCO0637052.1 trypsin-like serine protease [Lutimaribacter sp. EGI FJ00014]